MKINEIKNLTGVDRNTLETFLMLYYSKTRHEINTMELDKKIVEKIRKIKKNIPVQYIAGKTYFRDLEIIVEPGVFIPRPETEVLIEIVYKTFKNKKDIKVLDLCTGSGAIAISLKKLFPQSKILGADISKKAIKIAKLNAKRNNLKIKFVVSDLFENIKEKDFDLITVNPPYVSKKEMESLPPQVKMEPEIALNGGKDGFEVIKRILLQINNYLKDKRDSRIFIEIDPLQKELIKKYTPAGYNLTFHKDFNGRLRFAELIKI